MGNRILGLIIVSIILIIIDFYILKAILSVKGDGSIKQRIRFSVIWWTCSALLIIGVACSVYFNMQLSLRSVILVAFFLTYISKLFFVLFILLDDVRRGLIWLTRKTRIKSLGESNTKRGDDAVAIPRSEFLIKAGIAIASVPLTTLGYGIASGAYDYRIKHQTLHLPNLPKTFDGIKMGQISDIHSGSFYNQKAVKGGVDMLLAEKPDFIFFTGDLVNNIASEMRDYQDIFSKVKAPLGVYSVLGNHDYGDYFYGKQPSPAKAKNLVAVKATHKNLGWDLLLNENRRLKIDGDEIGILGIENWGAGRFLKYGRMDLAVKNTDDLPIKLLLSHDPSHWRAQVLPNYPQIDAMFSGHTHGMQIGVITEKFQWSPIEYIYKEWAGFYNESNQQLYVNVGYGFLGYPGRVGILPEITIFTLHTSNS